MSRAGASVLGAVDAVVRSPQTARDARRAAELGQQASRQIDATVQKVGILALLLVVGWVVLR